MKLLTLIFLYMVCFLSHFANGCIKKYETCGCRNKSQQRKGLFCHKIDVVDFFTNADFPESDISILDLSDNYNLGEISRETFGYNTNTIRVLQGIMKLDLSHNNIWKIAPETFILFTNLTKLNLSGNNIGLLLPDMFHGLLSLKTLDLSENFFPIIPGNAFTQLPSLKKLYVVSTMLVCNCLMKDFVTWKESSQCTVKGTCHLPVNLRGTQLRSISAGSMTCDANNTLGSLPHFEVIPLLPQLAFTGDSIKMQCEGTNLPESKVSWTFNGLPLQSGEKLSLSFNVTSNIYNSIITGWLKIDNLTKDHSGDWNCTVTSEYGSATKMVRIIVAEQSSQYCEEQVIKTDKGTFFWPSTLSGIARMLSCPEKNYKTIDILPLASRKCVAGNWSFGQYAACPYADEVTERVKDTLNASLQEKNIGTFMDNLWKSIRDKPLTYHLAVELIGELMEKISHLITRHNRKSLASPLLNLASYVMQANGTVLREAQQSSGACEKIIRAIRNFALEMPSLPTFDEESQNIAIGGSEVLSKEQYNNEGNGMSCKVIWSEDKLKFACDKSEINRHSIQSSIVFPKTFLDSCSPKEDDSSGYRFYFIAYRNGRLFQSVSNNSMEKNSTASSQMEVNGLVLEAGIKGCNMMNLSDPIMYFFETNSGAHLDAIWSPQGWTETDTCFTYYSRNLTRVVCNSLATVTLIEDPNAKSCIKGLWFLTDVAHPATLVGTGILVICLILVFINYACCYNKMIISSKHRHMIINTCIHLIVASTMFAFCIRRIDSRTACVTCGIILHFTSLSVLLWITVGVKNIQQEFALLAKPPPMDPKPPRPMLRFYLIGSGIPALICGITAAAKLQYYGAEEEKYCWLSWETSIFAFYSPAAIIAVLCIVFLIRVLCAFTRHANQMDSQRSPLARASWHANSRISNCADHYQAIRTEDDSFRGNLQPNNNAFPHQPISSVHVSEFSERSFKSQLCGAALLFIFYLLTWVFAALSIAAPSTQADDGYQSSFMDALSYREYSCHKDSSLGTKTIIEDVFTYAYAVMTIVLGIFMVLQHIACRKDIRSSWQRTLPCSKVQEHGKNSDMRRNSCPRLQESDKDDATEETLEYLTSANGKGLGKGKRGVYTTIKTDPTMETIVQSTDTGRNGEVNRSQYLQYHPSSSPKSYLGKSTSYQPDFMRYGNRDSGRPAKSITSLPSSLKRKHPDHTSAFNASIHGHSHIVSSSGQRQNLHSCTSGARGGYAQDPNPYHLRGFHSHHIPYQQPAKPVKLTNLHVGRHDSSMTEHSFDEMAHNNMHTIPVVLQHHTQPKVNNKALLDRYEKVRKALERKRAKQKRLNVLREYAQDPLTSNDEGQKDGKNSNVNESSPLLHSPDKISKTDTMGALQGGLKFRPLLLSPSNKKPDVQRPKTNGPTKRVKRPDVSGHPRPIRQDKRVKQNSRISHNSTLSEREQDTSSSDKSYQGTNVAKIPTNNAPSVIKHNFDSRVTPDTGRENHGYLTLQQLQSMNPYLFKNQGAAEAISSQDTDSKLNSFEERDKPETNSSLNSSIHSLQRNETRV